MNFDPTKKEMMNFLKDIYGGEDSWEDDAEVAIYWFANDYHGGQWSNLYSVLSTSPFKPGRNSNGPEEDTLEENMYEDLVSEFGNKKPIVKENKMSRFNLWEKLIKEEDEFDGEVAEMGDEGEVEDKIEDEAGDVIFDMAVNFILALPEDSVPEDMRTEYDTLMSKIGDDYLGGDDEGEGAEDLEDPKFDMDEEDNLEEEEDEEMKESKNWTSAKEEQYRKIQKNIADSFKAFDGSKAPKGSPEWNRLAKKWQAAVKRGEDFAEKNF